MDATPVRTDAVHRSYPTRAMKAPLVARGRVVFVNVRPDLFHGLWVCDECAERVRQSQQLHHARSHT